MTPELAEVAEGIVLTVFFVGLYALPHLLLGRTRGRLTPRHLVKNSCPIT